MERKVFLWTAPRCISTAFERCIMEVPDSKIFHEPYSESYHFGPERQSPRYLDTPVKTAWSYAEVERLLTKEYDGIDYIFSKDMAYAVENYFEVLLAKELEDFTHTFLIRDPRKTVPSLYRASVNTAQTGWDHFDPQEAGFKQMFELFVFLQEKTGVTPHVINADGLQVQPKTTVQGYCEAVGFPFDEKMLKWEPGRIDKWTTWNGWHDNALKSSGFQPVPRNKLYEFEDLQKYPEEVRSCIQESLTYYNALKKHCTKL